MGKTPLIYALRDEALRHNLKLMGNGRLTKHSIEAHKKLICEAVGRLIEQPPGEVVTVESGRDDIFIVVRSLETKPPKLCDCCVEGRWSVVAPMLVGGRRPSPPGRT